MTLSDIYQLRDKQTYGTQEVENVYFFERLSGTGTAQDLSDGFVATYLPSIQHVQAGGIIHTEIIVNNLGDLGDFSDTPMALTGLAGGGDTLPSFNALGYTLVPNTRAVRPGSKRYTGILEGVVTNGVVSLDEFAAVIEALRVKLDDNIVGVLASYQHVIVKRTKTAIAGTTPVKYKYTLPVAGDPLVLGLVKSARSNLRITSQVSRKF